MDASAFDRLSRTLWMAGSRRVALGALLATAGAALGLAETNRVTAHSCTLKANGQHCSNGSECCSGWCKRKQGTKKKFCRQAAGQGTCTTAENGCEGNVVSCGTNCDCLVTTQGRSFCSDSSTPSGGSCDSDRQCENRLGKGAKCIGGGLNCANPTFCKQPCS
jgi:hypothetical protein